MVPKLLAALEFRSNNERHRPVMQALELVKRFADTKLRNFPVEEEVPLDGVVRGLWRDAVVEKDAAGRDRVNRVTYEVAVLEALREQLRCKEIWVVGANRYRNPDEDLPADFEANRDEYYKALDLPLDADRFISQLQDEMREALGTLNGGLKKNPDVRIGPKGGGWITLTPLDPQPDPPTLKAFKAELNATWPMTGLLDMVKETDLRLRFTEALKSPTAYETLERSVLQPRLLLCLHGLGTNAGLQRMAGLESGVTAKDLAYVRRRYISVDALRRAIAIVADGTLQARNPAIWGSAHYGLCLRFQALRRLGPESHHPMACALWRPRHHDLLARRTELAVHPLPAQVAVLLRGRLDDRGRDPSLHRNGGRSTIRRLARPEHGRLCLLPTARLPAAATAKSYSLANPVSPGNRQGRCAYANLQLILSKPIDWELVRQQYDQMVKYTTALRLGTAETEAILRRFTRNNVQHPTYKAFAELGKAIKTIFLCRYLHSEGPCAARSTKV